MNTFNNIILKALKGNQEAVNEVQANGFEVVYKDDSIQGYPTLIHNGVELVISKDYDDRTYLFANYRGTASFKQLKHVDYMNLIRMTNVREQAREWFLDPLVLAKGKRLDKALKSRRGKELKALIEKKKEELESLEFELKHLER